MPGLTYRLEMRSLTLIVCVLTGASAVAAPKPPPPENSKARVAYREAMTKGRKATDAKKYVVAIAGFDAALAAKPGDPRALAERGYARLLEGKDLDAASRDLDLAVGATKDPKLLSMIWFNRGLVEEKRGKPDNARAAFQIANTLRPTAAAAAKLAGKAACPAIVEREVTVIDHPPVVAADWRELYKQVASDDDDVPATTAEVFERLTSEKTEPKLPAVILAKTSVWKSAYVVWRDGGKLHAVALGAVQGGRCPGELTFDDAGSRGTLFHATGLEMADGGYTFLCKGKDGPVECTGKPGEQDEGTACLGGSEVQRDVVVDTVAGKVLIVVEQPNAELEANRVGVKLADKGLELTGQGCDRVEPY
jgi:hypothetical protein